MTPGGPTRVIAATLGLAAFSVAIVAGLAADNPAETILLRAMASMLACHVVGWGVGMVAERAVTEAIESYRQDRLNAAAGAGPADVSKVKSEDVDSVVMV